MPFPRIIVFPSAPPKSGSLGSGVLVAVAVEVGVAVDVDGTVSVEVEVEVEVKVDTGLGFDVEVGCGGKYTNVFVGLAKTRAVLVANAVVVG
jgi:hypothetical protein